jgi:hypothetical protein
MASIDAREAICVRVGIVSLGCHDRDRLLEEARRIGLSTGNRTSDIDSACNFERKLTAVKSWRGARLNAAGTPLRTVDHSTTKVGLRTTAWDTL